MAITLMKSANKKAVKTASIEAAVDRLGEVEAEATALSSSIANRLAELAAEQSKLVEEILNSGRVVKLDKMASDEIVGTKFVGRVSAKRLQRAIKNKQALFDALGKDRFIELAAISLGDIDRFLTEKERAIVLESDHSGPRSLKVKAKTAKA